MWVSESYFSWDFVKILPPALGGEKDTSISPVTLSLDFSAFRTCLWYFIIAAQAQTTKHLLPSYVDLCTIHYSDQG